MLPGYNHNLNVDGVVFHVQTEDRGALSEYIETQVFVDGAIVHVEKTNYQKSMLDEGKQNELIFMMQEQHKSVLKKLSKKEIPGMKRYIGND